MSVTRCILNGSEIGSLDDLYTHLAQQLDFPEHFGRNLDALWDLLSTDVEGPFEIVWKRAEDSRKALGADFARVLKLFADLESERSDFRLKVE
jgi:ribonuclease inhibitor